MNYSYWNEVVSCYLRDNSRTNFSDCYQTLSNYYKTLVSAELFPSEGEMKSLYNDIKQKLEKPSSNSNKGKRINKTAKIRERLLLCPNASPTKMAKDLNSEFNWKLLPGYVSSIKLQMINKGEIKSVKSGAQTIKATKSYIYVNNAEMNNLLLQKGKLINIMLIEVERGEEEECIKEYAFDNLGIDYEILVPMTNEHL